MKKILSLFALVFLLGVTSSIAQKPVLNHIAHYIYDLQRSTAFYTQVIGLDTIPEPFHDGKHTWLSIGEKTHLHLIQGATTPEAHDKNSHICFTVPSVEQFIKRLKNAGVAFEDWAGTPGAVTHRVDGVLQIYFKDPDGYWIEVNDARQ
ncbi:MAG TPA: VOC family protein [Flavisolibacter sp.]|nr:VOC family protein [Flavisolibacter sp.]